MRGGLAEALDGVLSQSYSPLEIIIFDDCSPDRTAEIIERAIAEHPHRSDVRFIRNPKNMGAKGVGGTGLSMAKGEFIFFSMMLISALIYIAKNSPFTVKAIKRCFLAFQRSLIVNFRWNKAMPQAA